MTTMPTIEHPTNRANFSIVEVNGTSYAFSYKTLIAFRSDGPWRARVNVWGSITGKHLNALDPYSHQNDRVDETEFARLLALHAREQQQLICEQWLVDGRRQTAREMSKQEKLDEKGIRA